MLSQRTLLVLGAGASLDVGLPLGTGLAEAIADSSRVSRDRHRPLVALDGKLQDALEANYTGQPLLDRLRALDRISASIHLARSIDNFIDQNEHDPLIEEMGKVQIARLISLAEASSSLFVNSHPSRLPDLGAEQLRNTWYDHFCSFLFSGLRRANVADAGHKLAVISFNYDRCFEFYMIEALSRTYALDYDDAREIVGEMRIIHPYGSIGDLPRAGSTKGTSVPYGNPAGIDPWTMASGIRTFTEAADAGVQQRVREAVSEAETIVFLGFSFQRQNMELMATGASGQIKRVYSTGVGIAPQVVPELRRRIARMYGAAPLIAGLDPDGYTSIELDHTCTQLMKVHALNLA